MKTRHRSLLRLSPTCSMTCTALLLLLSAFAANTVLAGERPVRVPGVINPSLLYHNYCSVCHGDHGDGRSRAQSSLVPPPRDFTTAANLTRDAMITIVTHGKANTAMTAWKTQLNDKETEAVVDFIRDTFMQAAIDPRIGRGRIIYGHNCASCHGERGEGPAQPIPNSVPPRNFASPTVKSELTRERMIVSVNNGRPNTAMVGFAGKLPADDIEATVDYIRKVLMSAPPEFMSGTRAYGGRERDTSLPATTPATTPATGPGDTKVPASVK